MKKYEVCGKGAEGVVKPGEGKCITYPLITSHVFANNPREAEEAFVDLHPECDEIFSRDTKEVEMTPDEEAQYLLGQETNG